MHDRGTANNERATVDPQRSSSATTRLDPVGELANLDILRAYAVLLVFVSHVPTWRSQAYGIGFNMGMVGSFGVAIFFVHTSFVLLASLERQVRSEGREGGALRFMIRRVFRIYPLSITSVLVCELLARTGMWPSVGVPVAIANLLLIQNLVGAVSVPATLWSLPFEIQMYLVLPLLFRTIKRSGARAPRVVGLLWVAAAAVALPFGLLRPHWCFSVFQRIKYAAHFLPGGLAYASASQRSLRRNLPAWAIPLFISLGVGYAPWLVMPGGPEPQATLAQWAVCLGLGALIPRCRDSAHHAINRVAKQVAKYSYGIYLVHLPLVEAIYHTASPISSWMRLPLLVSATGVSSVAVFQWIEYPGMQYGKRLAARLNRSSGRAVE